METKFLILPPEERPTEACVKNCEGKWIVAIFKNLCLGATDMEERKKLCDKIKKEVDIISESLDGKQKSVLRHYMGNIILAYSSMAIEVPSRTGKDIRFSSSSTSNFTTCDVHKIIFGVVKLFETGTPEEKIIFINRLSEHYEDELFQSAHAVLDALELVYT